jgi:hypothetical protein
MMTRFIVMTAVIWGAALTAAAGAPKMTALPEGPDRDLVAKVCQACHDLQMVFDAAGISRDEWDMSLDEMIASGMSISEDDRAKILAYLATYLGPSPPKAAPPH